MELSVRNFSQGDHPNEEDRRKAGEWHETRGDYRYQRAGHMTHGDAYWMDGQSWTVQDGHMEGENLHVVAEPRKHMVNRAVISRLQFGVPDITLDEPTSAIHVFHPDQVIPVRQ